MRTSPFSNIGMAVNPNGDLPGENLSIPGFAALKLRVLLGPLRRLLVGVGYLVDERLAEWLPYDLHSQGQPRGTESRRHRERRTPGDIERRAGLATVRVVDCLRIVDPTGRIQGARGDGDVDVREERVEGVG